MPSSVCGFRDRWKSTGWMMTNCFFLRLQSMRCLSFCRISLAPVVLLRYCTQGGLPGWKARFARRQAYSDICLCPCEKRISPEGSSERGERPNFSPPLQSRTPLFNQSAMFSSDDFLTMEARTAVHKTQKTHRPGDE